ncbi:MAG: XdhC family protein, partial [Betaproteobacteria bacterium]|nr:XdhC family protein [Betaproteobacteria bacterium]
MNSIDIEVIRSALDWQGRGHRVVLGTVVRTWGSAPRPPGSMMIIRDDGQVAGSVSGGCIEDDLIRRVAAGELALHRPEATVYGQTAEEVRRFGLPCGGSVQVVLEPLGEASGLRELLQGVESAQRMQRSLDMESGAVRLAPAPRDARMEYDGRQLRTVHGPQLRLLIIGGGQLSRYLASMAVMLDYRVTVCEPRTEYHEGWDALPGVSLSTRMPDDEVLAMQPDDSTAVVALTHDPKLDDLALMEALRSPAFYVGALGSRHNNERRRERLLEFEVTPEQAARLHGPVGLRLGGLTPPEIAMSIVAEMTAVQRGADLAQPLTDWS